MASATVFECPETGKRQRLDKLGNTFVECECGSEHSVKNLIDRGFVYQVSAEQDE